MLNLLFKFIIIIVIVELISCQKSPIVELPTLGKLGGKVLKSAWSKRKIYQFNDIKYGESPSGENRFKV